MDSHHPAGKSNSDFTVPVPVNDHRAILSQAQYEWPKETLENPDSSPLRAAAACVRGFVETAVYLTESLLKWIAGMLEVLDEYLQQKLGPKWWLQSPLVGRKVQGDA